MPRAPRAFNLPHLALITTSGGPIGGMETFTRALVDALGESGWRVTVALSGFDFLSDPSRPHMHVEPVNWVNVADLSGDRRYTTAVVRDRYCWFRQHRPDVALFVQSSNTPLRASVLGARLAGIPIVTTQRTMPARLPDIASRRHLRGLLPGLGLHRRRLALSSRMTALLASRVVYNSEAVRAMYEHEYCYPRRKGAVIPNGVARSEHLLDTGEKAEQRVPVIGFVGRLGREKRVDVLLHAIAGLPSDVPVRVELYGEGPEETNLMELITQLGISDRVQMCGPVRESRKAYERLDIVVLCSPRESSSNMILEAMAAGCAVVVTKVGGLPELVEHGRSGVCIEPLNVTQLTEELRRLIVDRHERVRLTYGARDHVVRQHDPRRIADQWRRLLTEVAGTARRLGNLAPGTMNEKSAPVLAEVCS